MSTYETWSLILTGIYDALALLLLLFVAYEAWHEERALLSIDAAGKWMLYPYL
jgi:hypothetical protein